MLTDRIFDGHIPESQSQVILVDNLCHGHGHASDGHVDAFYVGMGTTS
jgi:hypothetical protein